MRINADTDRCVGSGQCVLTEPDVFDQREEDGIVRLLSQHVEGEQAEQAKIAAHVCPSGALSLEED
ncbi:MAG TPA: (4Fe-4S)-binding protein [Pseudonocardiaceae bacterium]|jgi:ferredoxin|nr:(4Fe-4S)-binding protein [Pseudonocardiaceae bacterium]